MTPEAAAVLPDPRASLTAVWSGPVHERFAARARLHPERPAVTDALWRWTYDELAARAAGLARRLRTAGVGRGDIVAVHAHRSAPLAQALLGILAAGAAFLILDPAHPAPRRRAAIRRARPRAWVEIAAAGPLPPEIAEEIPPSVPRVRIAGDSPLSRGGDDGMAEVKADDLAYVAFTSGSTGQPKGILGSHGPLAHFVEWHAANFGLGEDDRFSLLSGLSHDPLLRDVFTPLALGAELLIPDPDDLGSSSRLAGWMAQQRITVCHLTPAIGQILAEEGRPLPELRRAFFGGDVLTERGVARLRERAPGAACVNFYGATETPQAIAWFDASTAGAWPERRVPVGQGIDGAQLLVLNSAGELAAPGEVGEVCVRTPYLALGYLGEEGAERFAANPFTGDPADRVYRTGDRGRYRADGAVDVAGRTDDQIQVRGFRVEPAEVEAALVRHPAVREAVVRLRETGDGRRLLTAWLVEAQGPRPRAGELRELLRRRLPEPMLPEAFVWVDRIPLTPNGKLDRRALPDPEPEEREQRGEELPATPTEEAVAAIWRDLLGLERVDRNDNFFELGGHSLLATRVVSRLQETFGVELPLRRLFEQPTVAGLAALLDEERGEGPATPPPSHEEPVAGEERRSPLSFAQHRLWFLDQLSPESASATAYNLPFAARLWGDLEAPALAAAFTEIVRRHEVLRARFEVEDGEPVQLTGRAAPMPLPEVDLSGLGEPARREEALRLEREEAARPFDLARGPLLRLLLLRVDRREHALLVTLHHIAGDGWSIGILARELGAFYGAFRSGRVSPPIPLLPPLPLQYADFAVWRRNTLQGEALAELLAWWRDELAGAPSVLDLPSDRPRAGLASEASARGGRWRMALPARLADALRRLSRREGATLFMTLLAAFQALLHRYTGREDLLVGTPIANRGRFEFENLIGLFVNTLALRGRPAPDKSFLELLAGARAAALGAYAHQDLPFERLVEELEVERSLARSPLVQTVLALQNMPLGELRLEGLEGVLEETEPPAAMFDLSLSLIETGDGLAGWIDYAADLFDAPTVARLAGHYETLLEAISADPDRALAELPLLTASERQRLMEWNSTEETEEATPGLLLHRLFERQAALQPEAPAVIEGGRTVSYGELAERADRLAWRLRAVGVGPEVVTGIFLERGAESVAAQLAVLKAGGAYLPLDPAYPAERLAMLIEDSRAPVLVTSAALASRLGAETGGSSAILVLIDGEGQEEGAPLQPEVTRDHLAYVIYTSGSTGRPNGVLIRHGSAAGFILQAVRHFEVDEGGRVLQFAALGFDASVLEIWMALAAGAALVVVPEEARGSGPDLADLMRRERVTATLLAPSVLAGVPEDANLPGLRVLAVGGESCPGELASRWTSREGLAFLNCYGPTEATVYASFERCSAKYRREPPIGRPIAGARIWLTDPRGNPVPVGVPGELRIGGPGLARGYLGRPELTAERFVPDSFGQLPGERLYRTGDLARRLPDGRIEFLGRVDRQIKLRGVRIEPGEIESALLRHPGVREAVVLSRKRAGGRLVAYVTPRRGEPAPTADELRHFLAGRLPEALVPSAFIALDALPLTPSGKVDRAALPLPERGQAVEFTAPRGPVEALLASIWRDVLETGRVDVHQSFFDLGGHSLLAARLMSRVRGALGVELPLRALFEAPTVAGLAARIERERAHGEAPAPPLARFDLAGPAPLSFAQRRLWFLDRLEPGSTAYNLPFAARLAGAVDAGVLALALTEIARRHEPLRTTFVLEGNEPVQVVAPPALVPMPLADLSGLPPEEGWREALRVAAVEAGRPFDLERGPLFRPLLVRLSAGEHVLSAAMHHIVSDAWSMGVLAREVGTLYDAFRQRQPSPLPEPPVRYTDFAVWQRRWLTGRELELRLDFWRRQLADAPVLELPVDHPRPAVRRARGGLEPVTALPPGVRELARSREATPYMALLAAFQALLHRYTNQDDLVVGSPVAARDREEIEGLVGFFVNALALRSAVAGGEPFADLLARAREICLDAYAHQDLPFEKLVEELQPERSLAHAPLFQVVLTLDARPASLKLAGLEIEELSVPTGAAKFDLSFLLAESDGGIDGFLEYDADLFEPATARRLAGHFRTLLAGAVEDPGRRISELPLLSEGELQQLVREASAREEHDGGVCLHDLFAAQVARRPDAVAVSGGEVAWTYGELARRASDLAGRLRGLGVGPEVPVALWFGREAGLVAAILGVLEAGGAYVPLDPTWPAERVTLVLEDSGAQVLVQGEGTELPELPAGVAVISPEKDIKDCKDPKDIRSLSLQSLQSFRSFLSPDNTAYIIYTSGSTGRPKGVAVTHRNAARLLAATEPWFGFGERDVWTLFHSYAFDFSVWEIWGALAFGGRVVVVPWEVSRSPEAFADLLESEGVTVLNQTPAAFYGLIDLERRTGRSIGSALAWVVFGGEALDAGRLAPWWERHDSVRLVNMYGITETTVHVTFRPVAPEDAWGGAGSAIGRPIPDLSVHVLGPGLSPLPLGVPGELHVGGAGLARGYLKRPDLTAERFVPDPFAGTPGARLYRTGDLGRRLSSGELEYLGRVDRQVKVRGFRIEPGEIEAALTRHAGVAEAAVVVRDDLPGGRGLAAFWVAAEIEAPDAAELRAFLRERLPEPLVPAAFFPLERLPVTPNGKVDRRALAAAPISAAAPAGSVLPRTSTEELLAGIWRELLGQERIGISDDFFALGGHSLLAAQLASRIRETFGVEVPLRVLFQAPTLEGMAAAFLRQESAVPAPPIARVPLDGPAPLSFAQLRLWLLDRLEPGSAAYNLPLAMRMTGPLDADILARVLTEIVRRHEPLRTRFRLQRDGEPEQVVAPSGPVVLPTADLSGLPPEARWPEAIRRVGEEAARPFDLERGPLFRPLLLRLDPGAHVISAAMHHIVTDGWSMGVLVSEVAALYAAFHEGRPSPLPELPVRYTDFTVWQRAWLSGPASGPALAGRLAYWKRQLAGAPVLELPTDRPRPAARRGQGALEPLSAMPPMSARGGATSFMVLLAAFHGLLHRYTGQDDLVVGSPVAARNRREIEGLIGFFVNALALRSRVDGAEPFADLVERVKEVCLEAYAHQDLPFEKLVEELQLERSLAHAPLFQVVLTLEQRPPASRLPGLEVEGLTVHTGAAKFDLTLLLSEGEGGLLGLIEYDADLFDTATIRRLAGHFRTLLAGALEDPGRRISELPLLTEAEWQQLLLEGSAREEHEGDTCLHGLFAAQAQRRPDAVAVSSGEVAWTYEELARRAADLAGQLQELGVGPEVPVALWFEREAGLVAAILGVLQAGGVYVPLDPAWPAERVALVLEDSGARVLVRGVGTKLPELPAGVAVIGPEKDLKDCKDPKDIRSLSLQSLQSFRSFPDNTAYVIYTSGSTGRPKGVAVTHRNVARLLAATEPWFGFGERDVWTLFHSYAFDFSVWEIWGALAFGGRAVVVPWEVSRSPEAFADLLEREGVTVLNQTPSAFYGLIDLERRSGRTLGPALSWVIFGGEALDAGRLALWWERHEATRLVNMYGITETTVHVTFRPVEPEDTWGGAGSAIGRPIPDLAVHVLGPGLSPLPLGVPGELHVGGAGLALGYLNRPDLTAERFIPDPFSGEPGARLYHTGDRGRRLPSGELEYLGRVDRQVKVRGFRIEPGEIEAALTRHPAVAEAAVVVRDDLPGGRGLAAFWVPAGADTPDLRAFLKEHLPEPLVPAAFLRLERLPVTPNGKVDRQSLATAPLSAEPTVRVSALPRTPAEELLAGIWRELLGREAIGIEDDFFSLGGHSLLATQLASRIRETFGVEVSLRALFQAPILADMAASIPRQGEEDGAPPIVPVDRAGDLPLSFAQQRLWFLDRLVPGNPFYVMAFGLRLQGPLRVTALEEALREVVHRHESLRTTFHAEAGEPRQVVSASFELELPRVDLSALEPARWEEELRSLGQSEARRPFDLQRGPLLRAVLARLGADDHALLLHLHHIVSDGWSMGVLRRELSVLYEAFADGRPSPLPAPTVQYADFAVWQRRWLAGEALERQLAFWRRQLAGVPPVMDLPFDHPRPAVETFRGGVAGFTVPPALADRLRALGRELGATFSMTALAAFDLLLSRYTGRDDVVVGSAVANRNRRETEGLIGFFVNILVLRADVSGDPTFMELAARVREMSLDAYAHQDLPFEKLVEELQLPAGRRAPPALPGDVRLPELPPARAAGARPHSYPARRRGHGHRHGQG